MNLLFPPLVGNDEAIRSIGGTFLAHSKEMISCQLDSADAFVTHGSKLVKVTLSGLAIAHDPERLPEAMQSIMQNAIEIARDTVIVTTDYQLETMRLLNKHGVESQKVLAESLSHQFNNIETAIPVEKILGPKHRQAA
jgi:hypothetical protein